MNIPKVKLGIIAVSRDCFPMELSASRRKAVVESYEKRYGTIYECPTTVENELHMKKALAEVKEAGCNALVVYLGNFGPETSETLLAKYFDGPTLFVAAAEEAGDNLLDGRGDAYCGMLNASYNLKLRGIKAFIPEYPVGTPDQIADMIGEFVPSARAIIGLNNLKIISLVLVPRISLPATLRSSSFIMSVLRSKKTLSWICSQLSMHMQMIPVFLRLSRAWNRNWAKATRCPVSFPSLHSMRSLS
jgi:L-fucose isomerase-like protein